MPADDVHFYNGDRENVHYRLIDFRLLETQSQRRPTLFGRLSPKDGDSSISFSHALASGASQRVVYETLMWVSTDEVMYVISKAHSSQNGLELLEIP